MFLHTAHVYACMCNVFFVIFLSDENYSEFIFLELTVLFNLNFEGKISFEFAC